MRRSFLVDDISIPPEGSRCESRRRLSTTADPPSVQRFALRPVHHQIETRVEAHIFVAFLAYCLTMTLRMKLNSAAPGLTPREVLRSLAAIQLVDVHIPTTDGRELIMPRYTEPETQQEMILEKLNLRLPKQPPPRIRSEEVVPRKA